MAVKAEEGYKLQLSKKVGDDMLNIRADSVSEFIAEIEELKEKGEEIEEIATFFGEPAPKKKTSTRKSSKKVEPEDDDDDDSDDDSDDDDEDDEPTEKQIDFAKKLKIAYRGKTKSELSRLIDKKLEARDRGR